MIFFSTPKFWYRKDPGIFLSSMSEISGFIHGFFNKKEYKFNPSIKTIAIGGITVGGAGKTPVARYLGKILTEYGYNPAICLRGYGRKTDEDIVVDLSKHKFEDVGDEALLLAKEAKVIVAKSRKNGHDIAVKLGCDVLILDDGLSQRDILPTCKILVIDGYQGAGNGLMFPFGPLRQKILPASQDADLIFLVNEDLHGLSQILSDCVKCKTVPDFSGIQKNIIAFSGLGMNEKFFASLRQHFNVIKEFGYPDHYPYKDEDLVNMSKYGIQLVTTEKDFQRIPLHLRENVKYVKINLECNDREKLAKIWQITV